MDKQRLGGSVEDAFQEVMDHIAHDLTLRLRGRNPLLAAVSTPTCAPVLVGTRLRGGTANSARGAASFVAEAITTARAAGPPGC